MIDDTIYNALAVLLIGQAVCFLFLMIKLNNMEETIDSIKKKLEKK